MNDKCEPEEVNPDCKYYESACSFIGCKKCRHGGKKNDKVQD